MAQEDRRRRYLRKHRKAKERKRESSKHHKVSFVDLPGELRNQIYDYVIEDLVPSTFPQCPRSNEPIPLFDFPYDFQSGECEQLKGTGESTSEQCPNPF